MLSSVLPERESLHAKWLQKQIEELIPITAKTAFFIKELNDDQIELFIPLKPNMNDKSTLFGGVSSMMLTLSGWALISYKMKKKQNEFEVVVAKSQTEYSAPMKSSGAILKLGIDSSAFELFMQRLSSGKKASITLKAELYDAEDHLCAIQHSVYVGLV